MVVFRDYFFLVWKLSHFSSINLTLNHFAELVSWIDLLLQSLDWILHLLDLFALFGQIIGLIEHRVVDLGDHSGQLSIVVTWVWHCLSHLSSWVVTWRHRRCNLRHKTCRFSWAVLLSSPEHLTVLAGQAIYPLLICFLGLKFHNLGSICHLILQECCCILR